ncbi:MAG: DUF1116 domain-containing protein [Halanaerobiales bacterium]|nr:DUF1116 domain-containing protein [Halanaerobiales bacterium]
MTKKLEDLFKEELKVVNIGLESFAENLKKEGYDAIQVEYKPPAGGDAEMIELLDKLDSISDKIKKANEEALERIQESEPIVVDVQPAKDVLPNYGGKMILHAAPEEKWEDMAGPVRGAAIGACIYEGWADDEEAAEEMLDAGEVTFEPAHFHNAVGPMTGVVSPSMPVWIVENKTYGNKAYTTLNEGLGKVLRFGANGPEVIKKLKWMEEVLAPVLSAALGKTEKGINLRSITSQALHMGDEVHNRNKAATSLFIREITPYLLETDYSNEEIKDVIKFMAGNEHFYLNLSMPASKATMDAASGVEYSTVITALARNGVHFGITISGLGDEWFVGDAQKVDGLYFPGYTEEDACLDIGDSTISETAGVGGFAMAAAPAIVGFVGGTVADSIRFTKDMYEITVGENKNFTIPPLNFRGTPTGIDLVKIIEKDILPAINTGIAHKDPGIGQIGAGLVDPPKKCFKDALRAFVQKYTK